MSPAPSALCFSILSRLSTAALLGTAVSFSGCSAIRHGNAPLDNVGREAVMAGGVVAAAAAPLAVVAGAQAIASSPPPNRQDEGVPVSDSVREKTVPVPENQRNKLGHYQSSIPGIAPDARQVANSDLDWLGVSVSALYVFDSGIDLQGHTGWGGVVEGFAIMREWDKNWYAKLSGDLAYFEIHAHTEYGGTRHRESLRSLQPHLNAGGGIRLGDFDLGAWFGIGVGVTHSRGTRYNIPGSETSVDALLQLGTRLTWRPTDWCNVFAGYRVMWSVPFEVLDDDAATRNRYPSLSMQSVELGVSFLF